MATRTNLISRLDKEFSRFIRRKHCKSDGIATCFTCGVQGNWKAFDCGHFMSRRHTATRWDPDNANPQCRKCNSFNLGEVDKYADRLGVELAEKLRLQARETVRWSMKDLETLLERYKQINKQIDGYI